MSPAMPVHPSEGILPSTSGKTLASEGFHRIGPFEASVASLGAHDYRMLLAVMPAAIYLTDLNGRITFYNQAAADLWGHYPQLGESEWCGSWRLFHPDGTPMPHAQCPMAITLKEGREIRGVWAVMERPDGSRVSFRPFPTLLRDASGRITGGLNLLMDITEQREAEQLKYRLAAIVESSDDAVISKNLDGTILSWNEGANRLFGYTSEETIGKPVTMLIPSDRLDEETTILERVRRGEKVDHYETIRQRKDGRLVEISLTVSPIKDFEGRIIGASKIARDIAERKQAERQKTLLLREMHHRVKNTFATVLAIMGSTARATSGLEEFQRAFSARVVSLAKTHELLTEEQWQAIPLVDLLQAELSPYNNGNGTRIRFLGPSIELPSELAVPLGMAIHELTTNAVKHGSLSVLGGSIEVGWDVNSDDRGDRLQLEWIERDGPHVKSPRHQGFGSRLLQKVLTVQIDAEVSINYAPEGFRASIAVPLSTHEHG